MIVVRWWPPYSTGYKDQPCDFEQEAIIMKNWFESLGINASIVEKTTVVKIINPEL